MLCVRCLDPQRLKALWLYMISTKEVENIKMENSVIYTDLKFGMQMEIGFGEVSIKMLIIQEF